jgi:hypothetical protein
MQSYSNEAYRHAPHHHAHRARGRGLLQWRAISVAKMNQDEPRQNNLNMNTDQRIATERDANADRAFDTPAVIGHIAR